MHRPTRIKITDLNPHLMCVLCGGYFMDATTIIECLHSFCKSCIVRYLETSKYCPICDVQIHKTKPLLSIRSDQTLQEIVYKLVPGLFQNEMKRRREFYSQHPQEAAKIPSCGYNEEKGEVDDADRYVGDAQDDINFSLEYCDGANVTKSSENEKNGNRRYLHCPTAVTVSHLKKLVRAKYELSTEHKVEMMCNGDTLDDDFSLLDISYIYSRKRTEPLRLCYRIYQTVSSKRHETTSTATSTSVVATTSTTLELSQTNSDSKLETKSNTESDVIKNINTSENTLTTDKLRSSENGAKKDGQTKTNDEEKEATTTTTPKQNNQALERKRSAAKLSGFKVNNEKKRVKKRTRSDDVVAKNVKRATPDLSNLAALIPSTPRENGTREVLSLKEDGAKKMEPSASLQINGNASSSDVIDARKTSVDKENKQTEEKRDEFSNGNTDNKGLGLTNGDKVNGLVSVDGEKKLELVAGKT